MFLDHNNKGQTKLTNLWSKSNFPKSSTSIRMSRTRLMHKIERFIVGSITFDPATQLAQFLREFPLVCLKRFLNSSPTTKLLETVLLLHVFYTIFLHADMAPSELTEILLKNNNLVGSTSTTSASACKHVDKKYTETCKASFFSTSCKDVFNFVCELASHGPSQGLSHYGSIDSGMN